MFRQSVEVEQRPQCENMLSVSERQQGGWAPTRSEGESIRRERQRDERQSGWIMQDLLGPCKDFGLFTLRNEELLKSNPKRNGGGRLLQLKGFN